MTEMTTETIDGAHFAPETCQEHEMSSIGGAFCGAMVATQPGKTRGWCSERLMTPHGSSSSNRSRRGRSRRVRERSSLGTHVSTVASDHEDDGLFAQVRQRDDISLFTLTKQFVLEIKKQHDCLSTSKKKKTPWDLTQCCANHNTFECEQARLT